MSLLPLAMDMAAAKGTDLVSAMELVGRVAEGNVGMLKRYGIILREGASATEALAAMQKAFAGQAEAFASGYEGAMARYGAATGDLRETVGGPFKEVKTDILNGLADLAVEAGPYMEAFADAIRGGLLGLAQMAADAFYWGANIAQQFAAGLGSGTSYIASALNSIGDWISYNLASHSPPRLLPDLEKWGKAAAQTYLDAFGDAKADPGMKGMAGQFQSVADPDSGTKMAYQRYINNWRQREHDKERSRNKSDRSDRAAAAKAAEMEAKRLHDAQLQYALSTTDTAGQLAIMTRELEGVTQGSAEYFGILTRLTGLQKQQANEEQRLNDARLQWELAQADKAGQIAIYRRELAKTTEGTLEWYDIATKIVQLQKSGAGTPGGILKPLEMPELPKIEFPKINWEDVFIPGEFGPLKIPGLKTKLNTMGSELVGLIVAGMKAEWEALPEQISTLGASLKDWLTSTDVETAMGNVASNITEWLVEGLDDMLQLEGNQQLTSDGIVAHVVGAVALATEGIVDAGASIGFGILRGMARSLGMAKGSWLDQLLTDLMTTTSEELKKQIEEKAKNPGRITDKSFNWADYLRLPMIPKGAPTSPSVGAMNFNFTINAPSGKADDIAKEVAKAMEGTSVISQLRAMGVQ
jgi:hypothetical protein